MENRRLILAIALILFVWSGFNLFFASDRKKSQQTVTTAAKESVSELTLSPVVNNPKKSIQPSNFDVQGPVREINLISDDFNFVFSTDGARLIRVRLNNYKVDNSSNSELVKFKNVKNSAYGSFATSGGNGFSLPENLVYRYEGSSDTIYLNQDKPTELVFKALTADNVIVTKIFKFYPDNYEFDLKINITNNSDRQLKGTLNTSIVNVWNEKKKTGRYNFIGTSTFNGEDIDEVSVDNIKEESKKYEKGTLWSSFTTKYFAEIVRPEQNGLKEVHIKYNNDELTSTIINTFISPDFAVDKNETFSVSYSNYIGPRDYDILKKANKSFENIIDYGFFEIIARPLMVALKFFYSFLGNFGVAIILLTVCIKAIFWPLTQKSYSSMKDMQKLQPQMQKLRTKYGKDKQKLNQEMMTLYKENRVNPFGGCLPMLIQIPVFFALYKVLLGAIELRHAPFALWITDLSAPDTLISDLFGFGFALGPLPLIMGFTMFLQQKMTPTNMEPTQAKIMLFMPVFFTFIFLGFPSGLVLYWLVNNLLTIAQQYLINRKPA